MVSIGNNDLNNRQLIEYAVAYCNNLLFICTLNIVFPTINISSRNISLSAWSLVVCNS